MKKILVIVLLLSMYFVGQALGYATSYVRQANSGKVLYLTFDCGYENGNTEPILDALKKHNVQATIHTIIWICLRFPMKPPSEKKWRMWKPCFNP